MAIPKFFNSTAWGIIAIISGIGLLTVGTEWYHYLLGIMGLTSGGYSIYKNSKKKNEPRPVCEYCGYVALDARELHNHQITCEKKK